VRDIDLKVISVFENSNKFPKIKPPGYDCRVSNVSEALIFEQRATYGVPNSSKRWRWI
jgi:hypothetical protein